MEPGGLARFLDRVCTPGISLSFDDLIKNMSGVIMTLPGSGFASFAAMLGSLLVTGMFLGKLSSAWLYLTLHFSMNCEILG